jgi:hypothetical protein
MLSARASRMVVVTVQDSRVVTVVLYTVVKTT